jgi:REP element-mobilizing transposase RayT
MLPKPIYRSEQLDPPAYHLRYTWTGWPSKGLLPLELDKDLTTELYQLWESDGLRRLESNWTPSQIQFTFSVKPTVSPLFFVARVKGRLQHAFRSANSPVSFSRKVAFRTIGGNHRRAVEAYIESQVDKERFVDWRFSDFLKRFTVRDDSIRLNEPFATNSGRYWYHLHLVLVTDFRMRITDQKSLEKINRTCQAIAKTKGYGISRRSLMPDHLHLSLSGNIEQSPEAIALTFMNNTAYAFGQRAIWRPGYYVGSFGEFDMGAVRNR